jgi:hypothetical protein
VVKRNGGDVSQVQMHGKYICVVKPIQSITELLPLAQGINLTCNNVNIIKKGNLKFQIAFLL